MEADPHMAPSNDLKAVSIAGMINLNSAEECLTDRIAERVMIIQHGAGSS